MLPSCMALVLGNLYVRVIVQCGIGSGLGFLIVFLTIISYFIRCMKTGGNYRVLVYVNTSVLLLCPNLKRTN